MTESPHLTVGEIAEMLHVPCWKVRRVVDSLGADIPRAGLYRLIPRHLLATVAARLQTPVPPVPQTVGSAQHELSDPRCVDRASHQAGLRC